MVTCVCCRALSGVIELISRPIFGWVDGVGGGADEVSPLSQPATNRSRISHTQIVMLPSSRRDGSAFWTAPRAGAEIVTALKALAVLHSIRLDRFSHALSHKAGELRQPNDDRQHKPD